MVWLVRKIADEVINRIGLHIHDLIWNLEANIVLQILIDCEYVPDGQQYPWHYKKPLCFIR
jgi:hypothetical protein